MELTRRGFFRGMGTLIAAPAIVRIESLMPVRALIAPPALLLPNSYIPGQSDLTLGQVIREALRRFKNSNDFLQNLDAEYEEEFGRPGAMVGDTLRIRLPRDYLVRA